MELILMILLPFPLGLLVRNRLAAYLIYIAAHSFTFTVQTLWLVLQWVDGSTQTFGPTPGFSEGQMWGYVVINLIIFVAGLGLVTLGHRLASRRRARRLLGAQLEPA